jgi:hypothetical protein
MGNELDLGGVIKMRDEQSAEDDVIDGDEEEFDDVADSAHDGESYGA